MIVNCRTFPIKRPRMQEAVDLLRVHMKPFFHPHTVRIYTPNIAPFDILAVEIEFENLAEYDRLWTDWWTRPETVELLPKWYEVTEGGGTNEIWTLE